MVIDIPEGVKLDKLPEDASETLRLVRIGDYDVCPCIGQHVENTKEVGGFRITSTSFKAAGEREQNEARFDSAEHEQARPKVNEGSFRIVFKWLMFNTTNDVTKHSLLWWPT